MCRMSSAFAFGGFGVFVADLRVTAPSWKFRKISERIVDNLTIFVCSYATV